MRRLVAPVLMVSAAAAAMLVLGPAFGAGSASAEPPQSSASAAHSIHLKARASPLAGLNRTFLRLVPAARCDAGAKKARVAKRLRAVALRGAAKASPRVLNRKKKKMRRAIAVLRSAGKTCKAAAPPPAIAGTPPPAPPPAAQTITLHVASSSPLSFTETAPTAIAGAMRLELVNGSSLSHFVGVRLGSGQPTIRQSPLAQQGDTVFVDVILQAGAYQIFCGNNGHDTQGMTRPFTVTP